MRRKLPILIAMTPVIGLMALALVIGVMMGLAKDIQQQELAACNTGGSTTAAVIVDPTGVALSPSGLFVKTKPMNADQATNAATIAGIVAARPNDFPGAAQETAIIIAYATVIVESNMTNVLWGTGKSAGIFQQIPGWGTFQQRTNVTYATNAFLNALVKVPNWQTMPPGVAAQKVQRSSYPDRYAAYIGQAKSIYDHLTFKGGTTVNTANASTGAGCNQNSALDQKIDKAIAACMSKVGSNYSWKAPADGASLVSWCYRQAGLSLPKTLQKLVVFKGDTSTGLSATWIPASDITIGGESLQPGDIPFWSNNAGNTARTDAASTGLYSGSPGNDFTVATSNLLSATSHEASSRRIGGCLAHPVAGDPTCGKTRTAREVQIITGQAGSPPFDILGTQETSGIQFAALKQGLNGYDSYPENSSRMNNAQDGAVAVFWNASKFTRFAAGKTPGISNTSKPITNPWVGLRNSAGHKFYVMSVHYANGGHGGTPASIVRSARLTMQWVKSKRGPDTTVIVMGDFNDQPSQKLAYCVYTAGGIMQHAAVMADGGTKGCPHIPSYNGIDQIYATPGQDLSATNWTHMQSSPLLARTSDHTPSYVTFHLSGPAKGSSLGSYIGPGDPSGVVKVRAFRQAALLGVLRLSLTTPNGGTSPGSDYVGNDGFPGGDCVAYIKYILARHSARYHGGTLGDGQYVAENLHSQYGYPPTNHVPAIHAVVSFPGPPYGLVNGTYHGHVALVAQINKDGSIVVEESNWTTANGYGAHTVPASQVPQLTYVHTEVGWH